MTEWADSALVLRMGHFREADLWLKMLCRGHGLLTLFAFGGSRSQTINHILRDVDAGDILVHV